MEKENISSVQSWKVMPERNWKATDVSDYRGGNKRSEPLSVGDFFPLDDKCCFLKAMGMDEEPCIHYCSEWIRKIPAAITEYYVGGELGACDGGNGCQSYSSGGFWETTATYAAQKELSAWTVHGILYVDQVGSVISMEGKHITSLQRQTYGGCMSLPRKLHVNSVNMYVYILPKTQCLGREVYTLLGDDTCNVWAQAEQWIKVSSIQNGWRKKQYYAHLSFEETISTFFLVQDEGDKSISESDGSGVWREKKKWFFKWQVWNDKVQDGCLFFFWWRLSANIWKFL